MKWHCPPMIKHKCRLHFRNSDFIVLEVNSFWFSQWTMHMASTRWQNGWTQTVFTSIDSSLVGPHSIDDQFPRKHEWPFQLTTGSILRCLNCPFDVISPSSPEGVQRVTGTRPKFRVTSRLLESVLFPLDLWRHTFDHCSCLQTPLNSYCGRHASAIVAP